MSYEAKCKCIFIITAQVSESHDLKFFGCPPMPGMAIIIIKEDADICLFYPGDSKVNVRHYERGGFGVPRVWS